MPRLFYKDLKAHEKAYRDVRADEAVNDLILGSKVNKLRNLETNREKAIDTVAKNYGDFLKSLKVKNVELVNRANNAEKALDDTLQQVFDIEAKKKADEAAKAAKAVKVSKIPKIAKNIGTNVLMPGERARSNTIASEAPTEFSEDTAIKESYDTVKKRLAHQAETNIKNITNAKSMLKAIKSTFMTDNDPQRGNHLVDLFNEEIKLLVSNSTNRGATTKMMKQVLKNMRA